jgi:glucoamylase
MVLFSSVFSTLLGVLLWSTVEGHVPSNPQSVLGVNKNVESAIVLGKNDRICSDSFEFKCGSSDRNIAKKHPSKRNPAAGSLEEWIYQQRKRSFKYLLENIAPNGSHAKGAAPGTVLASPSKNEPNYYYQWVRDAAITIKDVVEEYGKTGDDQLKTIIDCYANLQGILQNTYNPSGGYTTGGLGEPKFMIDGAPFTENWGRPQRDGPALRALTLMKFVRTLNHTDPYLLDQSWLQRLYDGKFPTQSVIKADLEYTSQVWHLKGFDLWEEVNDLHFFTASVQHRALVEGRDFAADFGDPGAAHWYDVQQLKLQEFLETSFWDAERGHLKAMLNTTSRCGSDCAVLLGSLHGGGTLFPAWSDKVLASLEILVADMATRHPISKLRPPFCPAGSRFGVGIGRYPEDIYDGVGTSKGNPWFLCTSSVSSILYRAANHFAQQGYFDINQTNLRFFSWLHPEGKAIIGKYTSEQSEFEDYLVAMFKFADSFLNVIKWHATDEGRLSEQFNRHSGWQEGAHDLTWSYGSFIGATNDRDIAKKQLLTVVEASHC